MSQSTPPAEGDSQSTVRPGGLPQSADPSGRNQPAWGAQPPPDQLSVWQPPPWLGAGQPALAEAQRERDTARASLETAVLDLQGTKADLERERATSATCGAVFSDVDAVIKTWVEFLKAEQAYARTSVGSAAERRAGAKLDKMFDTLNGKIVSLQPDVTACRTDGA